METVSGTNNESMRLVLHIPLAQGASVYKTSGQRQKTNCLCQTPVQELLIDHGGCEVLKLRAPKYRV